MKKIFRTIRGKFHADVIRMLQNIIDKLNEDSNIKSQQCLRVEDKLEFINKTIKNDIQNEINNMKEEIITNSQLIKDTRDKLYRGDWEVKNNIKQYLHQIAGIQTAEYVIKNMSRVPAFNVTLDILTYGLSKVSVDGLYLEFGVFSGKTINHIAENIKNKTVYGFDSFEGLPENWRTGFGEGTFKRDDLPEVKNNVELVKGWFDKSLPLFLEQHDEKCAFIHIDCDLYSSTKCVFDLLKDRIISGTIIVFDEYFNYPDWQNGEYKALQEFISENNMKYEYIGYVEIMEQVAIRIL